MAEQIFDPAVGNLALWAVLTVIFSGVGAYFGAYLRRSGEQRAILEGIDAIARKQAEAEESMKVRWTRRSEVIATLYGTLAMKLRALGRYLKYPREQECKEMGEAIAAYEDRFITSCLFLPKSAKEQFQRLSDAFSDILDEVGWRLDFGEDPPPFPTGDEETAFHERRHKCVERIHSEIRPVFEQLEEDLRRLLNVEDARA